MGKVILQGDILAFEMRALDAMFQEIKVEFGENDFYNGRYTFTIYLNQGYELISATRTNMADEEVDIIGDNFTVTVSDSYDLIINVVTQGGTPDREVTGFNRLYKVDKTILKEISGKRFVGGGVDLAEYFINILELPFSLDDSNLGEEQDIQLGSETIGVLANEIIKDSVRVDLGTIHIPNKYNNSYDYTNTTINLHLPFVDSINLELEYVLGYDISTMYIIDLYSGDMTVNVSSSRVNKVIHSEKSKIGRDIPFIRRLGGNITNQITPPSGVMNDVLTPYIEVVRNKPYVETNIFKTNMKVYDTLSNMVGYVSVNNIMLSTDATAGEKDMILSHLRNGVYIK